MNINVQKNFRACCIFLVALAMLLLFTGCYYYQQGVRLLGDQLSAVPISRCVSDTSRSDKERRFLAEIERIKTFAIDSIGLISNSSYTRYVKVDSSYLVAVLCAADSASFTTKKWCYPFFGCFPLRAYYDMEDAKKTARKFVRQGYEINIDKVDGFSTLGIFSDPVYSFMSDYTVFAIAQYIFHEQTHATVYFKNVQFSEEFATFIAREGAQRYLAAYYGKDSKEFTDVDLYKQDMETYLSLLRNLYATLDTLYSSKISRKEKIESKKVHVAAFRKKLDECYDSLFCTPWYKKAAQLSFNNAFLAVRMTYTLDLDLFKKILDKNKGDLRASVQLVKQLKKKRGDPKELLKKELDT